MVRITENSNFAFNFEEFNKPIGQEIKNGRVEGIIKEVNGLHVNNVPNHVPQNALSRESNIKPGNVKNLIAFHKLQILNHNTGDIIIKRLQKLFFSIHEDILQYKENLEVFEIAERIIEVYIPEESTSIVELTADDEQLFEVHSHEDFEEDQFHIESGLVIENQCDINEVVNDVDGTFFEEWVEEENLMGEEIVDPPQSQIGPNNLSEEIL